MVKQVKLRQRAKFFATGSTIAHTELFIGVCYRTPSENVYGYGIHASVRELVSEISNKNFVLFGDHTLAR